jgi:thioredoxin-related protein
MWRFFCLIVLAIACNFSAATGTPEAPSSITWLTDYQSAAAIASQTKKPIFIECFAKSCRWCDKMQNDVYTDSNFIQFMTSYVPLRLDIEDGNEGTSVAKRYNVKTLPTVLVVDANGALLNRIGGNWTAKQLITDLSMIQALLDRERVNQSDWTTMERLAKEYLFRDMNAEAQTRFEKILKAPVDSVTKESAHFSLALAQYYQQKTTEALQTLRSYLETYVDGKSTEEVLLLLSQIHLERKEDDQAKQILTRFLDTFPESKSANRVREVLSKLSAQ